MKENLKTLAFIVIALSLFAIAIIEILKLTTPKETGFPSNFIENKKSIGPAQKMMNQKLEPTNPVPDSTLSYIDFAEEVFHFGDIQEGEKVTHEFKFRNTGRNPLIIQNAKASCGCTIPTYSKEPIAPGKGGVVSVMFNSEGRKGKQRKAIHITANTAPNFTLIEFTANVLEKKNKE